MKSVRPDATVRRPHRLRFAVAASGLLITGITSGSALASTPERTFGAGTVVLSSGAVDEFGRGVGDASIVAFARPTSAALDAAGARGVRLIPLAAARSTSDGHFIVAGDLSELPATHVGKQGQVDLEMVVSDSTHSITWMSTTFRSATVNPAHGVPSPVTRFDLGTGDVWGSGDDPAGYVDDSGRPLGVTERTAPDRKAAISAPNTGLAAFAQGYLAADATTRRAMLSVGRTQTSITQAIPNLPDPGGCGITYWLNSYKYDVQEHYLNVYSFSGAPVTVTEGTSGSSSQTLGVVAEAGTGTLSLAGTQSISVGVQASQSGVAHASVSNRVNYREQAVTCVGGGTWHPYSLYDFLTDFTYAPHVNYAYCQLHLAGYSWSTSTATNVTYSGGVSFPRLSVSAQSGYGTSQRLTYNFKATGYLCGNSSSGPGSSSQLSAKA